MKTTSSEFLPAGKLSELKQKGCITAKLNGHSLVLFHHEDKVHALDIRCPHLGFPLNKGSVKDGILTCHWHHARFDLCSGGTFDPWADDVQTYPVKLQGDTILVNPHPTGGDPIARWKKRLQEGLEQNISLVIAKSIIHLLSLNVEPKEIAKIGILFGTRYRSEGWGPGLTILTAMTNILLFLNKEDRYLALYHGLVRVSNDCTGHSPRFDQQPLDTKDITPDRIKTWFRNFVEVRDGEGTERCLLTSIIEKESPEQILDMLLTAETDHILLDIGHMVDFTNKSYEALDLIGWEYAKEVLPSLMDELARADRSEESSAWRHPIDLISLLEESFDELPKWDKQGRGKTWKEPKDFVDTLLSDNPHQIVETLKLAIQQGAKPIQISQRICYAAALRVARFHTKNEFGDWITVLHTFTYCNAYHQALKRISNSSFNPLLWRGLFHGAISVYLDRFLNIPMAALPQGQPALEKEPKGKKELLDSLLQTMNSQQRVNESALKVYRYLSLGHPAKELIATLGHSLLREDGEFHSYQMLEAGIQQFHEAKEKEEKFTILVAVARYLSAHSPTSRAMLQTADIALRLHRGEELYVEEKI